MTSRTAWLLCGIVVLGAYMVLSVMMPTPLGSPEIRITPPSPYLAPRLAVLSGVWEPAERSFAASRIAVEQIDETRATILLTGLNDSPGYSNGGWERVRARVSPDGQVQWGYPVRYTLRVAEDGVTLEGKIERGGVAAWTTLRKLARPATPRGEGSQDLADRREP